MKLDRAISDLRSVVASERLPHALLVVGPPRGAASHLVETLLQDLYHLPSPDATHRNLDIHWLEPEGKSRSFKVGKEDDVIRPQLEFLAQTSYQGGWKTLVLLFADRLSDIAQNVLLKTLEEPPPNSLLVLVTSIPAALLPTVRSRLQTFDVSDDASLPSFPGLEDLLAVLRSPPPPRPTEVIAYADALALPLRAFKKQAEEEETEAAIAEAESLGLDKPPKDTIDGRVASRVKELREDWFKVLLLWQQDLLLSATRSSATRSFPDEAPAIDALAARTSVPALLSSIRTIQRTRELLDHNIRESLVLPRLARSLALP